MKLWDNEGFCLFVCFLVNIQSALHIPGFQSTYSTNARSTMKKLFSITVGNVNVRANSMYCSIVFHTKDSNEHLWIWVSAGVLEPFLHGYRRMTVKVLGESKVIRGFSTHEHWCF